MVRTVEYDQVAKTYDRRYRENDYSGVEAALMTFIGEQFDQRVLEVGCGTGHWLRILDGSRGHVIGLDASAQMLVRAKAQAPCVDVSSFLPT